MKSLMSINNKFMSVKAPKLVQLTGNNKYINGYEIFIDSSNPDGIIFLKELAYACKQNNLIFQVHGDSSLEFNEQLEYMKMLENISDLLGYKISVVLHPLFNESKKLSIVNTFKYLNKLLDNIDNNKIMISLENLNDMYGLDRLNKNEITSIICNEENLYFTYDLGHEIIDYGAITNMIDVMNKKLVNVHIHTFSNICDTTYDHLPILKGDEHWNQILKGILYLKNIHYNGNVVFEYALEKCNGSTIEEKIKSYVDSIEYVSERLN